MLLRDAKHRQALRTAEKMRQAIACANLFYKEKPVGASASFGVATLREGDVINALLERADMALYRAKRAGRNCVCSDTEG